MNKLKKDWGVKATFGAIIICSFVGLFAFSLIKIPHMLNTVKDAFVPLVMAIIGFYFGASSQKNNKEQ